jgi:hypothetical protein
MLQSDASDAGYELWIEGYADGEIGSHERDPRGRKTEWLPATLGKFTMNSDYRVLPLPYNHKGSISKQEPDRPRIAEDADTD